MNKMEMGVSGVDYQDRLAFSNALSLAKKGDPQCLDWILQFLYSCKRNKFMFRHCAQLAIEAQNIAKQI
jgi:hypothetical protein